MTNEKLLREKLQQVSSQLNTLLKEFADSNIPVVLDVVNDTSSTRDIKALKPIFYEKQAI